MGSCMCHPSYRLRHAHCGKFCIQGCAVQAGKLQTEAARLAIRLGAARDAAQAAAKRTEQLDARILAADREEQGLRCGTSMLPLPYKATPKNPALPHDVCNCHFLCLGKGSAYCHSAHGLLTQACTGKAGLR